MTTTNSFVPPPELVMQWWDRTLLGNFHEFESIATQAAQWGADQELEACVNYIDNNMSGNKAREFRAIRRPKSLSRKEQALEAIGRLCASVIHDDLKDDAAIVRRALEQLPDAL